MHVPFMRFPAHVSCNMPDHFSERMNSSRRALPGRGISYAKASAEPLPLSIPPILRTFSEHRGAPQKNFLSAASRGMP